MIRIVKWMIAMLFMLAAGTSSATERIDIVAQSGRVGIVTGNVIKPLQGNASVPPNSTLVTAGDAHAVVRVGSTGYVVLGENSRIKIGKPNDYANLFRQVTGIIYYAINTLKGDMHPVNVRTDVSSLGIRGTRFMVVTKTDKAEIAMRKGIIAVQSLEGDFELYNQTERDQFEAYQQEAEHAMQRAQREFEDYKEKSRQEFLQYTAEFDLSANQMASIDGKRATTLVLSEEAKAEMGLLERIAGQWLEEVRD